MVTSFDVVPCCFVSLRINSTLAKSLQISFRHRRSNIACIWEQMILPGVSKHHWSVSCTFWLWPLFCTSLGGFDTQPCLSGEIKTFMAFYYMTYVLFTPLCNICVTYVLMLPLLEPLLICKWVLSSFSFYFWSVYCNYDIWVSSKLCAAFFNRLVSNELAAILSYFVIR